MDISQTVASLPSEDQTRGASTPRSSPLTLRVDNGRQRSARCQARRWMAMFWLPWYSPKRMRRNSLALSGIPGSPSPNVADPRSTPMPRHDGLRFPLALEWSGIRVATEAGSRALTRRFPPLSRPCLVLLRRSNASNVGTSTPSPTRHAVVRRVHASRPTWQVRRLEVRGRRAGWPESPGPSVP